LLSKKEVVMENKMEDYVARLKRHDWYYDYSDDHNAYMNGSTARRKILELADELDPNHEIFNQYAPEKFKRK
jgi:hypothetical protein